jgi:hypothetical protein
LTIHHEGRSAVKSVLVAFIRALVDLGRVLTAVQTIVEFGCIQTKLGCIGFQFTNTDGRGFCIEQVVIFPKLALIKSTLTCFGSFGRRGGDNREILPDKSDFIAIRILNLF